MARPRRVLVWLLMGTAACAMVAERFCTRAVASDAPATGTAESPTSTDEGRQESPDAKSSEEDAEHSRFEEIVHKLRQGGMTIIVQALLSVFGLAVILERLCSLRRSRIVPSQLLARADALWWEGKCAEIETMCEKKDNPLARTLTGLIKHRNADFQTVSTITGDIASREMRRHLQKLFPVVIVATIEPLLGLLGTIFGMIGAFDTVALAGSMGDASLLADDIAKALVTTAFGLCIAIPALFVYHILKNRTLSFSAMLEEEVSDRISRWLVLDSRTSARIPTQEASDAR